MLFKTNLVSKLFIKKSKKQMGLSLVLAALIKNLVSKPFIEQQLLTNLVSKLFIEWQVLDDGWMVGV